MSTLQLVFFTTGCGDYLVPGKNLQAALIFVGKIKGLYHKAYYCRNLRFP
jgi:hypothetical protein